MQRLGYLAQDLTHLSNCNHYRNICLQTLNLDHTNMKLINDIINDLVNLEKPLEEALLKTKVLATRINNPQLLSWINGEINGFPDGLKLPEYRKTSADIIATYLNGNWKYTQQAISLAHLNSEISDTIKEINVVDSISSLEKFAKEGIQNATFSINGETQKFIEMSIRKMNPRFQILEIYRQTTPALFSNILSTVRSKLLEFMLAIEQEFGTETEIEILKSKNNTVTTIMNTTINNHGDANVINTGNDASIKNNNTIYKGDKNYLAETLKANQVDSADVQELLEVVDAYPPEGVNIYSSQVKLWIQKMTNKALDGTWQVGIGAAGSILADALATHYGWK